ncbi:MAG: helix-turn-helix transcriptional regulator [Planctomycetes bacterium]|nr:helix-turn-helix transcriptional regulator [Planctomycetota bacterium]
MISKTLENELAAYNIGEKVRDLRSQRGLKLIELGSHTGLSAAMLSKIERGKLIPTLPTLMRIALVFSVGLEYFFTDERERHAFAISRKGERIRLPAAMDRKVVPFDFENLDYPALEPKLSAYTAHFKPLNDGEVPVHSHPGVEFIYLVEGRMELTWHGEKHELEAGDSVYFESSLEHGYRRLGNQEATAVVVTLSS